MRRQIVLSLISSLLASAGTFAAASEERSPACHVGSYLLTDGSIIDLAPSTGDALRWRMLDGRVGRLAQTQTGTWVSTEGWTKRPDGIVAELGPCDDQIEVGGQGGRRIALDVSETSFQSRGETLYGKLVLPKGSGPVPIMVMVHGSEEDAATVWRFEQRLFPAHGVGVFVYDKRGTGRSTGKYTQDFSVLADDAAAAIQEARKLAGSRSGRVGVQGGSQGGWVAPLAASRTSVDYVLVGFGMAQSPLEENLEETLMELKERGFSGDAIKQAEELTRAANAIMASRFTSGFERFDELRTKYREQPWFKALGGEFTGEMTKHPTPVLREAGPARDRGTSWTFDPMPLLQSQNVPQLWILAQNDREAPSATTARRLTELNAAGRPIAVAVFPKTDHGIYEYVEDENGERTFTRVANGYFEMMLNWARDGTIPVQLNGANVTPIRAPAATKRQ